MLFSRLEIAFPYSAERTYPVFWDILKRCSRGNPAVRVSSLRVIYVAADNAYILFHILDVLMFTVESIYNVCAKFIMGMDIISPLSAKPLSVR